MNGELESARRRKSTSFCWKVSKTLNINPEGTCGPIWPGVVPLSLSWLWVTFKNILCQNCGVFNIIFLDVYFVFGQKIPKKLLKSAKNVENRKKGISAGFWVRAARLAYSTQNFVEIHNTKLFCNSFLSLLSERNWSGTSIVFLCIFVRSHSRCYVFPVLWK